MTAGKRGSLSARKVCMLGRAPSAALNWFLYDGAAGNGFAYDIPSRAKGNQLYVPELDRIVLKDSTSKRPFASTQQCRSVGSVRACACVERQQHT
jgi:hypothetical protein